MIFPIKKILLGCIPVAAIGVVVLLVDRIRKWQRTPHDILRTESSLNDFETYGDTLDHLQNKKHHMSLFRFLVDFYKQMRNIVLYKTFDCDNKFS